MKPTQEKTMEWEKDYDKKFIDHKDSWNVPCIYGTTTRKMKNYIKSLLTSSQDSFRRKAEEEVIGKDDTSPTMLGSKTYDTITKEIISIDHGQIGNSYRNGLRAEQRAKLKNIK